MVLPLVWKLRKFFGQPNARHRKAKAVRPSFIRPRLEALEDRTLLATRLWSGAGLDANWTTAANWVGGVAPSAGDDLVFAAGASQLTNSNNFAAGTTFNSITFSGNSYALGGNQLTLTTGITMTTPVFANAINAAIRLGGAVTVTNTYVGTVLSLNGAIDTNGNTLTVGGSGDTSIAGVLSGTGGLVKNGPGTLSLSGNNSYGGLTTINAGIVNLNSNSALGASGPAQGTVVNSGATLQVPGGIIGIPEPLTVNGHGVTGGVTGNSLGALNTLTGFGTFNGPITLGSDTSFGATAPTFFTVNGTIDLGPHTLSLNSTFASSITINGAISGTGNVVVNRTLTNGPVILTANNTYTGTTTVAGGTLTLSGSGRLASTSIFVNNGPGPVAGNPSAVLTLDNTGTDSNDRLPDTATVTLNGGAFSFVGSNAVGATSSETVASIVLNRGQSTISSTVGSGAGGTATLTAGNLVRNAGATANFSGVNLGTASNRILFTTAPATVGSNGGILSYATFNNADFATYNATNGVTAFTGYVTSIAAAGPDDTVRLLNAAEAVTVDRTINALYITNDSSSTGTVTVSPGATLTLASGGLILRLTGGLNTPAIVPGVGPGVATLAFGDEGKIFTHVGIFSSNITTRIAGSNGVIVGGASTLNLNPGTAGSTYTGDTILNAGGLNVNTGTATPLGAASNLLNLYFGSFSAGTAAVVNPVVLNNANVSMNSATFNGSVTLTGSNTLNVGGTVTVNGQVSGPGSLSKLGGGSLILGTSNTYSGGTTLNGGGLNPRHANALGTGLLTLASGTLATDQSSGLTLVNPVALNTANVILTSVGGTTFNQPITLAGPVSLTGTNTVSGNTTISGAITGTGALTKTGGGTFTLNGSNSYTGATTVNGGTLLVNGSQSSSPLAVVGGSFAGAGTVGPLAGASFAAVNPGDSLAARGILTASGANFSNDGNLAIQIAGFGTAGVDYDRLNLGSGVLTLGGNSRLTLDLAGLTTTGTATGVITYGSRTGIVPLFNQVAVINNPNNYLVSLDYTATGINVIIAAGAPIVRLIDNSNTFGNGGFGSSGNWFPATGQGFLDNVIFAAAGNGFDSAGWNFTNLPLGLYRVSVTWSPHPNRATNAPFTVQNGGTDIGTVLINQELAPNDFFDQGAFWEDLNTPWVITAGSLQVRLTNLANEYVIADAVRIERVGDLPSGPEIQVLAGAFDVLDNSGVVDFGDALTAVPLTKTFTIKNLGGQVLNLSGPITLPTGYTLVSGFGTTSVNPGASTTFVVRLDANAAGSYSGQISFGTNDSDENPFNFTVTGTVGAVPLVRIIDNSNTFGNGGFSLFANWTTVSGQGFLDNVAFSPAGTGFDTAGWNFTNLTPGIYQVAATWSAHPNRATNAPFTIFNGSTPVGTVQVNQELTPNDFIDQGVGWKILGHFTITGTILQVQLTNNADEYVIADGIRIQRVAPHPVQIVDNDNPGFSATSGFLSFAGQGFLDDVSYAASGTGTEVASWTFFVVPGTYRVSATWSPHPNRATNAPFTVLDGTTSLGTVQVNQELTPSSFTAAGVGWHDLGNFTITGNTLVVRLTDLANEFVIADAIRIERIA